MLTVMEWPVQSPEHNPITPISPAMEKKWVEKFYKEVQQAQQACESFKRHARVTCKICHGETSAEIIMGKRGFLDDA